MHNDDNLVWPILRVVGPALVFVVITLTLVIVVKMNVFLAFGIGFAISFLDFLVFSYLKKQGKD